jgi:MGT family glycosyltransferase
MCLWAKNVSQELKVPSITIRASFAANEHFNILSLVMQKMMQQFPGMRERPEMMKAMMAGQGGAFTNPFADFSNLFRNEEQLNIVIMPKEFQPAAETFDDRYVFVGSSILPRREATDFPFDQLKTDQPLLYISLGSVAVPQLEFFKLCFDAFAEQPWQVVLSIGKLLDPTTLGPAPDNFLLAPYVPQLEILPRTHIFVTHAGANSVIESMHYGVPMVLIPQQPEQQIHAQRVVEMGLGVMLGKDALSAATLREAVERVDHDPAYRERMQQMQQVTRAGGGYQRAADAIMQFAQERVKC